MKRIVYILFLLLGTLSVHAQTETNEQWETDRVKNFGGFILDMGAMLETPALMLMPPTLNFNPGLPEGLKLNPDAISLPTGVTYTTFSRPSSYSIYSLLYPGMGMGNTTLQGTTYQFKNGMRLTTYGEYDADGYKRPNPSALPWEKNNFHGGFEWKSANGRFGVRMEVKTGRNYPY